VSEVGIFVDFGSTFTKVVAMDIDHEEVIGAGKSPSTVKTDITVGLSHALDQLQLPDGQTAKGSNIRLACSSAAGGLRLVVIGLVPSLSMNAGRLSALGAGAKLIGAYSYKLNQSEINDIERLSPDIVLLVGGTDGGNEEVIIHNAKVLASSNLDTPVVVAGNKSCADHVKRLLESGSRHVAVVDNVLGELDKLNVEPSRRAIREIFMERIIRAKGLDKANHFIDGIIMPTPMAVLKAAELMSQGHGDEEGLGELMVVDIGGATTDIHSVAKGDPKNHEVMKRGIPEPFAKRTVEGDLGIRYNALSILEDAGLEHVASSICYRGSSAELERRIRYLTEHTEYVPSDEPDRLLDAGLARAATEIAVERHAGRLEEVYSPHGAMYVQLGKDLTEVKHVIGTGGIFAYGQNAFPILEGALFSAQRPFSLKPKSPDFLIDRSYILFAVGLLGEQAPRAALRIGKKYLNKQLVYGAFG